MYKKLFLDIGGIIIILCMFAYILSVFTHLFEIPFIQAINVNNQTLYSYDIMGYIRNLEVGLTDIESLKLNLPTRQWNGHWLDLGALGNDLAFMFDWSFILLINVLLYPIRILGYILRSVFCLLGNITETTIINNNTYNPQWYMQVAKVLMGLYIPYF